jgi:hypothetical protein
MVLSVSIDGRHVPLMMFQFDEDDEYGRPREVPGFGALGAQRARGRGDDASNGSGSGGGGGGGGGSSIFFMDFDAQFFIATERIAAFIGKAPWRQGDVLSDEERRLAASVARRERRDFLAFGRGVLVDASWGAAGGGGRAEGADGAASAPAAATDEWIGVAVVAAEEEEEEEGDVVV